MLRLNAAAYAQDDMVSSCYSFDSATHRPVSPAPIRRSTLNRGLQHCNGNLLAIQSLIENNRQMQIRKEFGLRESRESRDSVSFRELSLNRT